MPLFEYTCAACGARSEILHASGQKPICPHCGSKRLQKELSTFATRAETTRAPCGIAASACGSGGCGGTCPHSH